jgi:hypothetical protein
LLGGATSPEGVDGVVAGLVVEFGGTALAAATLTSATEVNTEVNTEVDTAEITVFFMSSARSIGE